MGTVLISLRIDPTTLDHADSLVPRLSKVRELAALGTVSRSQVLRLALARGLAELESQYPKRGGGRTGKKQRRSQ